MSTPLTPPLNQRYPFALDHLPPDVQQAHIFAFNAILDLQKANEINSAKLRAINTPSSGAVKSVASSASIVVNNSSLSGLGAVRDETGSTAYTNTSADNGILLILNDASPVAVTLDSAMTIPYALFVTNFGAGTTTLTPTSGTINGGGSLALLQGQTIWLVFDGTNWKSGAFTTPPQNTPAVTHEFITAYNATTGAFSQAQPAFTDISGSLAVGQLPSDVPQVSFGTGAPAGSSTEGFIYFDTTGSPYHGYVFHSAAWNQFS